MKRIPKALLVMLRDRYPRFQWHHGTRSAIEGKCIHVASLYAELTGGTVVNGFYHGQITAHRPFLRMGLEADGSHQHSWVEKDGMIYDPTWWAFTDAPLGVYTFPIDDRRYVRHEA